MPRIVSINGAFVSPETARVSVYDRGFLYGDGVFETVRTYGGKPFALTEHIERLAASCKTVGIQLPVSLGVLEDEVTSAISASQNSESYVRMMITRGTGPLGLDPTHVAEPLRVLLVEPLAPLPAAIYTDGVAVITTRTDRAADAAPGAKVTNYLANMLALQRAKAAGCYEALLLDSEGLVLEGTTSNFFLVIDGELLTPPKGLILSGITRHYVALCAEQLSITVRYGGIGLGDLAAASEAFLTSSLREIVPVVRVDNLPIGSGKPGPLTRRLHETFRARAGAAPL